MVNIACNYEIAIVVGSVDEHTSTFYLVDMYNNFHTRMNGIRIKPGLDQLIGYSYCISLNTHHEPVLVRSSQFIFFNYIHTGSSLCGRCIIRRYVDMLNS
jgi:hypothetical protein